MRIAFLTRHHDSASSRVRAYQWIPHLERVGHEVRTLPWAVASRRQLASYAARAVRLARWADVVVLLKPCQPPWIVDAISRANPHLVVDFDDALWVEPFGSVIDEAARHRLLRAVQRARIVTVGSSFLANWVSENAPGTLTVVIPPCVELERYPRVARVAEVGRRPVMGWIGLSENFADIIPAALDGLREVVGTGRGSLKVISGSPLKVDGLNSEFEPWSLAGEVDALRGIDVGIMPLPDHERSRGRCGYKAMQCMAVGAPVVASPVSGALEVVDDGVTGFFASTQDDWVARLGMLLDDGNLRVSMGANARQRVEEHFSVQAQLPTLLHVFEQAAA